MSEAAAGRDRLGLWCGWVLVGAGGLTPLLAWLGPLAFAPLMGLTGLLCLPALRIGPRELPLAIVLGLAVAWAAASSAWSPHRWADLEDSTALKLVLQLPLYWAAWQGARRADPRLRRLALQVFAWGLAVYGAILLAEAFTNGGLYQAIRSAIGDPIRPDLGRKNIAQGAFALALLWPVAAAGGARAGAPVWLALPMAAGTFLVSLHFLTDAPALAVGLAVTVTAVAWIWPRTAPGWMAVGAAGLVLIMPLLVLALTRLGVGPQLPLSWSQRVGYWTHAIERLAEHPWRGWGLEASRAFSPYIQLHPHNGPLQIWLELGVPGALAAALAWAFAFRRIARDERSLAAAATAGSAAVYLFIGMVSFGVWQEWWLALAALAAVIAALADAEEAATPSLDRGRLSR